MENEINENTYEVISLRSKSNSIQKVSDIDIKIYCKSKYCILYLLIKLSIQQMLLCLLL